MEESIRVFAQDLRLIAQQIEPVCKQIVEIHEVERLLALAIGGGDGDDVLGKGAEIGIFPADGFLERSHGVDGITDDVSKHIPPRKPACLCVDPGIGNAGIQERLRVVRVHDGVIPAISQKVTVPPEHAICYGVKRAAPEPAHIDAGQEFHAPKHFPGGLVREGRQEDPLGRRTRIDQTGDPVGQRPRLAAPRPGDDQDRASLGRDDAVLLGIQIFFVIDRQRFSPATVVILFPLCSIRQ